MGVLKFFRIRDIEPAEPEPKVQVFQSQQIIYVEKYTRDFVERHLRERLSHVYHICRAKCDSQALADGKLGNVFGCRIGSRERYAP
jgi:hypothetical protein